MGPGGPAALPRGPGEARSQPGPAAGGRRAPPGHCDGGGGVWPAKARGEQLPRVPASAALGVDAPKLPPPSLPQVFWAPMDLRSPPHSGRAGPASKGDSGPGRALCQAWEGDWVQAPLREASGDKGLPPVLTPRHCPGPQVPTTPTWSWCRAGALRPGGRARPGPVPPRRAERAGPHTACGCWARWETQEHMFSSGI